MKLFMFFFTISLYLISFHSELFGQVITKNPYVENHTQSEIADLPIVGVAVSDELTMVLFDYITDRNLVDGWISLSSKTILTARNSSVSLKIKEWGIYIDEDLEGLDFNEKYSVKADRKYTFYMIFPKLPPGLENISIRENEGIDEFFWKGIHINNPVNRTRSDEFQNGRGNDIQNEINVVGSGSGFAISSNGHVVTSYHVVKSANRIYVRGINGDFDQSYKAKVHSLDKNNDLAILKIDDAKFTGIKVIPYTISDKISEVGEDVFVMGYPLRAIMGDEIKLTNGLISSRSGFQGDVTSYQISATVQSGNSGCPLFDKKGNIIGVVNARLYVENAAYAVKSPYLLNLVLSMDSRPLINSVNILHGKTLSDQVKEIKNFIFIIEVAE